MGPFPKPWVKTSLFYQLMLRGPTQNLLIDTVDRAGRWEIGVYGFQPPSFINENNARNACQNAIAWNGDQFSAELYAANHPDAAYNRLVLQKKEFLQESGIVKFAFWTNTRSIYSCIVEASISSNNSFSGRVSVRFIMGAYDGSPQNAIAFEEGGWLIYSPTTSLVALQESEIRWNNYEHAGNRTSQPSFDCQKDHGEAEVAICGDSELIELDVELSAHYSRLLATLSGQTRSALITEERDWIRARNACRKDKFCLSQTYNIRIQALNAKRY